MNFIELETEAIEAQTDAQAQLTLLYARIILAKKAQMINIVQNTDFVNWSMTFGGPETEEVYYPTEVA